MKLVLKRACICTKVMFAFAFIALVPTLITVTPADALPMEQEGHGAMVGTPENCLTDCARTSVTLPPLTRLDDREVTSPDPEPESEIPFYVRYMARADVSSIPPGPQFTTTPLRPPDIVLTTSNLRF